MKISLNWLKDYVTLNVSLEALAHRLTMAGLEVEKIHSSGKDTVFELEITPNRPDCLNMLGIARELAAILDKSYKSPAVKKLTLPAQKNDIVVQDKKGCPVYRGIVVKGVKITSSPDWIKVRLSALGIKAINNVVDITNFCLLETGQPLHAFDYDKLIGHKIIVRRAAAGERILTLDGIERTLDPGVLVIADAKRPVAIAGIMGGKETEVTAETKNILLESAYFDPVLVRLASRKLGLGSDSSYRFERGIDISGVGKNADRALALIMSLAKGKIARHSIISDLKATVKDGTFVMDPNSINIYLGASVPFNRSFTILKKLGFQIKIKKNLWHITSPTFRRDIHQGVDIIEEVARVIGYDQLPLSVTDIKMANVPQPSKRALRNKLRDLLISQGLSEAITYTMINEDQLARSQQGSLKGIRIQNPLSKELNILRPSILPSLLSLVLNNFNKGQKDIKCFELGKIYTGPEEKEVVGIVMTGKLDDDWRREKAQEINFYDLKGIIEQTFRRLSLGNYRFEAHGQPHLAQAESAAVILEDRALGFAGRIQEGVLKQWDIKNKNIYFAQIELDSILNNPVAVKKVRGVSEYPSIVRDVSIAIKKNVSFEQIQRLAQRHAPEILKSVMFLEEYLGERIPSGHRGLIFSLTYQSSDRTLTENEVDNIHSRIREAMKSELNAVIR